MEEKIKKIIFEISAFIFFLGIWTWPAIFYGFFKEEKTGKGITFWEISISALIFAIITFFLIKFFGKEGTLRRLGEIMFKVILGLFIFFGLMLSSISIGDKFNLSGEGQLYVTLFLITLLFVVAGIYKYKKEGRLISKEYWKSVVKDAREIVIGFFDLIKVAGWLIGIIIVIIIGGILLSNFIGAIGTIPLLIIVLIFVVGSRLENIEAELRELRNSREDRFHNNYD